MNVAVTNTLQATNDLRDIKPPVEIPAGWAWLLWVAAALLLLALAFWLWRRHRARGREVQVAPPVPPHLVARRRLEEALSWLHEPKTFCILVSDTTRWYLEQRFDFRAPERTTEEFLRELQQTTLLSEGQKQSLGEFLERCDLVKFARYEPWEAELRELHGAATRLVSETEPMAVPEAQGAHAPANPTVPVGT